MYRSFCHPSLIYLDKSFSSETRAPSAESDRGRFRPCIDTVHRVEDPRFWVQRRIGLAALRIGSARIVAPAFDGKGSAVLGSHPLLFDAVFFTFFEADLLALFGTGWPTFFAGALFPAGPFPFRGGPR